MSLVYGPLNEATEEIRLLEFRAVSPPQDSSNDPIELALYHVPKQLPPRTPLQKLQKIWVESYAKPVNGVWGMYTALSYVWGEATPTRTIWIDGCPVEVTENLFTALQRLGMAISRDYTAEPRAVWIDAICINQADEDEKRKQIP
jgi:hypothetical protein